MNRYILRRSRAFRKVFGTPENRTTEQKIVLKVLADFCRSHKSSVTVSPLSRQVDALATCVAEGRREVMSRILHYIQMDQENLIKIINEAEKNDVQDS